VSPLDTSQAVPVSSAGEFGRWLRDHGGSERERVVAIYKKASGRQTVTFDELLDTALCHGWVDTQTKGIDEQPSGSCPGGRGRTGRPPTASGSGGSSARAA
jgi:uncharacterized protein YdeI (YjbR/CyaY-like superfamily)